MTETIFSAPGPILRLRFDRRPRVRFRTLNLWRWVGVGGQLVAIALVHFGLGYQLPATLCFVAIAVGAIVNLGLTWTYAPTALLSEREATAQLGFDIVQLSALLMLTGGIENPFALLFIAPVVISATNLSLFATGILVSLTIASIAAITAVHWPLPWDAEAPLVLPPLYVAGTWIALVLSIGFTTIYAWRTAHEARNLQAALAATQAVLAREQRLSDLGALAAATAHQLGTPLGTIAVVARELERDVPPDSPLAEDIKLLRSQAERCRDILKRLGNQTDATEEAAQSLPLAALLDEIASPHRGFGVSIAVNSLDGASIDVLRSPGIVHSLNNLIENAVDYARTKVAIDHSIAGPMAMIRIHDDGPGFEVSVLDRLGEPFVTTRASVEPPSDERASDVHINVHADGHAGLGLGIFIAKTLIERSGGSLEIENGLVEGAIVIARIPFAALKAKGRPSETKGKLV
jgi:two-component system sensor histidine kinase RegB